MSKVYFSAKDAFSKILDDTKERVEKDCAIYDAENLSLSIVTDSRGKRPACSPKGPILESEFRSGVTLRDWIFKGRDYTLVEAENYSDLLNNATRDDLYLFASLANPNILNDEVVKNSFYDRLEKIQMADIVVVANKHEAIEELAKTHSAENTRFDEFFSLVEGAVEVSQKNAFYACGHEENPTIQPEQSQ